MARAHIYRAEASERELSLGPFPTERRDSNPRPPTYRRLGSGQSRLTRTFSSMPLRRTVSVAVAKSRRDPSKRVRLQLARLPFTGATFDQAASGTMIEFMFMGMIVIL